MDFELKADVDRILPEAEPDSTQTTIRMSRYGEPMVQPVNPGTSHNLADEGTYFVATNPTPGTALAGTVSAAFSDTVPFIYLANQENALNLRAKNLYPEQLKLIVTVPAATGTAAHFAIVVDSVARTFSTDNAPAIVPVSPNLVVTVPGAPLIKMQNSATASAITASSQNKRIVARGSWPSGLTVIGDELIIVFGRTDVGGTAGLTAAQAVMPARKVTNAPPVIIPPGCNATIHVWFPGNATTGLSYEAELTGWLR